jgi:hypothetical protein
MVEEIRLPMHVDAESAAAAREKRKQKLLDLRSGTAPQVSCTSLCAHTTLPVRSKMVH